MRATQHRPQQRLLFARTAKASLTLSIIIPGVISFTSSPVKVAFGIAFFSLNKLKGAPRGYVLLRKDAVTTLD
jgi:hypothetical protein